MMPLDRIASWLRNASADQKRVGASEMIEASERISQGGVAPLSVSYRFCNTGYHKAADGIENTGRAFGRRFTAPTSDSGNKLAVPPSAARIHTPVLSALVRFSASSQLGSLKTVHFTH
jgi:hypothetical protein